VVKEGLVSPDTKFFSAILQGPAIYGYLEQVDLLAGGLPYFGVEWDWSYGASPIYKAIIENRHPNAKVTGDIWKAYYAEWEAEKFNAYPGKTLSEDQEDAILTFKNDAAK